MPSYCRKKIFSSFTLIELLVVIAIISVVSLAVIPQFVGLGGNRKLDADVELFVSTLNSARTKATTNVIMPVGLGSWNNCTSKRAAYTQDTGWAWSIRVCPESEINIPPLVSLVGFDAYRKIYNKRIYQPEVIQNHFNQKVILTGITYKDDPLVPYCEYALEAVYLKDSFFNCNDSPTSDYEIVFDKLTGDIKTIDGTDVTSVDLEICDDPACSGATRTITIGDRGNITVN